MDSLLLGLSIVALLLVLGLAAGLWKLTKRFASLREQVETAAALPAAPGRRPVITVEILNPFELASKKSKLAGPAAALAPWAIERIVYQRTTEILIAQLDKRGVDAQVRIHGIQADGEQA